MQKKKKSCGNENKHSITQASDFTSFTVVNEQTPIYVGLMFTHVSAMFFLRGRKRSKTAK